MKRKFKLLLSLMTAIGITSVISVTSFAEESTAHLKLNGGYADENTVTAITASLTSETDIAAYSISVNFNPDCLEFVTAYSNIEYGNFYYNDISEDSVTFIWSDNQNRNLNGDVFTAKFKTKGDTSGQVIKIEPGRSVIGNDKLEEIEAELSGCEITVLNNYKWGDANNDGIVSLSDVTAICKFTMDSENYPLYNECLVNSDTDKNNIINSDDSNAVLNYIKTNLGEANTYE